MCDNVIIICVDIHIHLKSKEVESIFVQTSLVSVLSSTGTVFLSMLSLLVLWIASRTAWIHVQSGAFKSDSLLSPSTSTQLEKLDLMQQQEGPNIKVHKSVIVLAICQSLHEQYHRHCCHCYSEFNGHINTLHLWSGNAIYLPSLLIWPISNYFSHRFHTVWETAALWCTLRNQKVYRPNSSIIQKNQ